MKKSILLVLISLLLVLPISVRALSSDYETMNLEQTLKAEEIKYNLGDYKETDDQIKIYMFRGQGCHVCQSFLEFLNSVVPEYGKYFKLVSFETWYDSDNSKLLDKVGSFMGEAARGVPYIVIGDKVFGGYTNTYDEEIKKTIVELYNESSRYDVFDEMEKAEQVKTKNPESTSSVIAIVLSGVFSLGAALIVVGYNSHKYKELNTKLEKLEKELKKSKKSEK